MSYFHYICCNLRTCKCLAISRRHFHSDSHYHPHSCGSLQGSKISYGPWKMFPLKFSESICQYSTVNPLRIISWIRNLRGVFKVRHDKSWIDFGHIKRNFLSITKFSEYHVTLPIEYREYFSSPCKKSLENVCFCEQFLITIGWSYWLML